MKKIILLILAIASIQLTEAQTTISGVTFPKKVMVGETTLELNGVGVRSKYWMDMYVAGLYLKTKSKDAKKIMNENEHASIKIQIVSSLITSEKMIAAVKEGFDNSTHKNTGSIQNEIDMFIAAFKDEIKTGDVFDIFYVPSKLTTMVMKNGKVKAKIEGIEFKKALLGIWLSDNPADKKLKEGLLGNS